jgi:excisionase family DNA binding protein
MLTHNENSSTSDRMITVQDVMALAQIGRTTVYEAIKRGHLRPVKVGTSTRFWRSEVMAWLDHL